MQHQERLALIARWLQHEDEALLYTPDRDQPAGLCGPDAAAEALANGIDPDYEAFLDAVRSGWRPRPTA